MGCVVNGPGEARDADIGIAAGKNKGHLFVRGQNVAVVPEDEMVDALVEWADVHRRERHRRRPRAGRSTSDAARRAAERDRAELLDEQGADANDSEQRVELIRKL